MELFSDRAEYGIHPLSIIRQGSGESPAARVKERTQKVQEEERRDDNQKNRQKLWDFETQQHSESRRKDKVKENGQKKWKENRLGQAQKEADKENQQGN